MLEIFKPIMFSLKHKCLPWSKITEESSGINKIITCQWMIVSYRCLQKVITEISYEQPWKSWLMIICEAYRRIIYLGGFRTSWVTLANIHFMFPWKFYIHCHFKLHLAYCLYLFLIILLWSLNFSILAILYIINFEHGRSCYR